MPSWINQLFCVNVYYHYGLFVIYSFFAPYLPPSSHITAWSGPSMWDGTCRFLKCKAININIYLSTMNFSSSARSSPLYLVTFCQCFCLWLLLGRFLGTLGCFLFVITDYHHCTPYLGSLSNLRLAYRYSKLSCNSSSPRFPLHLSFCLFACLSSVYGYLVMFGFPEERNEWCGMACKQDTGHRPCLFYRPRKGYVIISVIHSHISVRHICIRTRKKRTEEKKKEIQMTRLSRYSILTAFHGK